jgi:tryptophanase
MAVGLQEVLSEDYLCYRKQSAAYLARGLCEQGVPIVMPPGMHAIYIDATSMLKHIPKDQFPGQSLVCALYLEAGIRSCEIGSVMFGRSNATPENTRQRPDLVRLALPRRLYNQSHYDYVIEAVGNVHKQGYNIPGMRIVWEPPSLRHFTAVFEPIIDKPAASKNERGLLSLRT